MLKKAKEIKKFDILVSRHMSKDISNGGKTISHEVNGKKVPTPLPANINPSINRLLVKMMRQNSYEHMHTSVAKKPLTPAPEYNNILPRNRNLVRIKFQEF
jgi:hypothetical protein